MDHNPETPAPDRADNEVPDEQDDDMTKADVANGEGDPEAVNDTEAQYGKDESPA